MFIFARHYKSNANHFKVFEFETLDAAHNVLQ
jgi:hypothetical protein